MINLSKLIKISAPSTKLNLHGILITKHHAQAINAHSMVKVPHNLGIPLEPDECIILTPQTIKQIETVRGHTITRSAWNGVPIQIQLRAGSAYIQDEKIPAVPRPKRPLYFALNAQLLLDLQKAMNDRSVTLELNLDNPEANLAIRILGSESIGILMPVRLNFATIQHDYNT